MENRESMRLMRDTIWERSLDDPNWYRLICNQIANVRMDFSESYEESAEKYKYSGIKSSIGSRNTFPYGYYYPSEVYVATLANVKRGRLSKKTGGDYAYYYDQNDNLIKIVCVDEFNDLIVTLVNNSYGYGLYLTFEKRNHEIILSSICCRFLVDDYSVVVLANWGDQNQKYPDVVKIDESVQISDSIHFSSYDCMLSTSGDIKLITKRYGCYSAYKTPVRGVPASYELIFGEI